MFHLDQAGNLKIRWNLVLYARLDYECVRSKFSTKQETSRCISNSITSVYLSVNYANYQYAIFDSSGDSSQAYEAHVIQKCLEA